MWPPLYNVRQSARAKHIRLKISRAKGLEIIIPQHHNQYDINALLDKHRSWIEAKYDVWQPAAVPDNRPQQIELRAIGASWRIHYQPSTQPMQLSTEPGALLLTGCGAYQAVLKLWLKQQAQCYLLPLLANISQEIGLRYHRTSIRLQSTRWGSCSNTKDISLNAKLLFLPYALVRHVIIHELCHTVYLDHSKRFWALVASVEHDYQANKLALRKAGHYIPTWIER